MRGRNSFTDEAFAEQGFNPESAGGGCWCYRREDIPPPGKKGAASAYVMVTRAGGAIGPTTLDEPVDVGFHAFTDETGPEHATATMRFPNSRVLLKALACGEDGEPLPQEG